MDKITLRFVDKETGKRLSAKECLRCLSKMADSWGSYGWHPKEELKACTTMLDKSEEECETYLTQMEIEGGRRLSEWQNYQ